MRGSPGVATIGTTAAEVDLERRAVRRARVGAHDAASHVVGVGAALLHEVLDDRLVGLDDAR